MWNILNNPLLDRKQLWRKLSSKSEFVKSLHNVTYLVHTRNHNTLIWKMVKYFYKPVQVVNGVQIIPLNIWNQFQSRLRIEKLRCPMAVTVHTNLLNSSIYNGGFSQVSRQKLSQLMDEVVEWRQLTIMFPLLRFHYIINIHVRIYI